MTTTAYYPLTLAVTIKPAPYDKWGVDESILFWQQMGTKAEWAGMEVPIGCIPSPLKSGTQAYLQVTTLWGAIVGHVVACEVKRDNEDVARLEIVQPPFPYRGPSHIDWGEALSATGLDAQKDYDFLGRYGRKVPLLRLYGDIVSWPCYSRVLVTMPGEHCTRVITYED